jgi:Macrocin-O-methyltransferase (TylF)
MTNAASVRAYRQSQAYEKLYLSHPSQFALDEKWDLHDHAADHLGRNSLVAYLEFGVASGDSLRRAALRFTNPETRLIGFDSFYGLPEDWSVGAREERIIPKGTFSQEGKSPQFGDQRVSFVAGWFQNTLPEFLSYRTAGLAGRKVLIHFDADLYSSTLFVLSSLWSHVPEYYFIMDDFFQDDMIALHDFTMAYPVEIEWIAHRKNPADLPSQVFGRMRRIAFQLGNG